jgi:alkylation response protein AidB-like acyl-CoA dehydrogenase
MRFQLEPLTEPGRRFVALAEQHAADFADGASDRDREGRFPAEAIEAMKVSGFSAGPVPEEFGGMGVGSLHDLTVAVSRLGRADGSIAIAIHMHLVTCSIVSRLRLWAHERGDTDAATALEGFMALLGGGGIALANITESGTDPRHPLTEVTPVEGGWRLDGRKIFGTMSEVADVMTVTCRRKREDGTWGMGRAIAFRGMPGQTILDNWDALGMRASGSHDVVYENCLLGDGQYTDLGDWGAWTPDGLVISTAGNIGLLGAFLGIAEAARDHVAALLQKRTRQPSGKVLAAFPGIQHGMAELEVDLATCRAHLGWIGRHLDTQLSRPAAELTLAEMHELNAAFQCTKLVVNRKAIDVVDKAMQLSGGAGYLASSPLSRLYRDVRAGPFMQPFSPNEAYGYIGKMALGQTVDDV